MHEIKPSDIAKLSVSYDHCIDVFVHQLKHVKGSLLQVLESKKETECIHNWEDFAIAAFLRHVGNLHSDYVDQENAVEESKDLVSGKPE